MRLGKLVFGNCKSGADLTKYLLMLGLLLLAHLLHNPLILNPIVLLIGLSSASHTLFNVLFLALLSNLRLTVDQAKEVISVQIISNIVIVIVLIRGVVSDLGQSLLVKLIGDELLAHLDLHSGYLLSSLLVNVVS